MKRIILLLLALCLATAFADPPTTSDQPLRYDANGNVKPSTVAGHPLNLPANTTVNGHGIASGNNISAFAGLNSSADTLPYFTGSGTMSLATLTAAARSLLDDTSTGAMLTTLGALPTAGGTMSGTLTLAGAPSGSLDAATKGYVDSVAQGLDLKDAVACATTANISLTGEQTIDGVTTSTSRVLVKNQSTASQNGIYVSASGAWSRSSDMDSWAEVPSAFTFVSAGTTNGHLGFVCTSQAGGTLDTTAITWTQFSGAGTYAAGTGLSLTGSTFAINNANLLALGALSSASNELPYFTGSGTASLTSLTSFARTLLADSSQAAMWGTLGFGDPLAYGHPFSYGILDTETGTVEGMGYHPEGSGWIVADPDDFRDKISAAKIPQTTTQRGISKEVWIAIRTDGIAGTGAHDDPYDGADGGGNTSFDVLMASFSGTPNMTIHLVGPGPFLKHTTATWLTKSGWTIIGDGRDFTVCQLTGSKAIGFQVAFFGSDSSVPLTGVTIRDLTIDGNYNSLTGTQTNGFKTAGVDIVGSYNLVENVHTKNFYGDSAHGAEHFDVIISASSAGIGTNNIIRNCLATDPKGDYGSPYCLGAAGSYVIQYSGIENCAAVGVNNSTNGGFTTGGANLSNFQDCWVTGNNFYDCFSIVYFDTNQANGLFASGNTAVRAQKPFALNHASSNIRILNNAATIQKRADGAASYGITNSGGTTNLVIKGNTFLAVSGGTGDAIRPIYLSSLTTADIENNTADDPDTLCTATGTGVHLFHNIKPDGTPLSGLGDNNPKRYIASVSQSGTANPVATVMENSLGGTLVWTRTGVGTYAATLSGAFSGGTSKVWTSISMQPDDTTNSPTSNFHFNRASNDVLSLQTSLGGGSLNDGVLAAAMIEVRVYP